MIDNGKLYKHLKNGECNKASELLKKIYSEFVNRKYASIYVFVMLVETVRQMNTEVYGFYFDTEKIEKNLCSKISFGDIERVISEICVNIKAARRLRSDDLLKKAIDYIKVNYSDSCLSAGAVADSLGVQQSFLTDLFKSNCDMGIWEYITNFRTTKAAEMIEQGDYKICELASVNGFNTSETFIRAFKRIYYTTPGRYRKLMNEK